MNTTDNVMKALRGDQNAISELYYSTYPKLRAVAISILKNENDAEDIVQDSYIKAFTNLDTLMDASKFESWIGRITANKCRDYLKKHKPILFSEQNTDEESEPIEWSIVDESKDYNPEEVLLSADTKKQIWDILNTLPDEQRICLIYHVVEDMKITEIAQLLDISENTVKSRINYAKSKMQNKIDDLEKNGIKLRSVSGFALFPLIRFIFSSKTTHIPPLSADMLQDTVKDAAEKATDLSESVSSATQSGETLASSSSVVTAASKTATKAVKKATKHLGLKITAGIATTAIAATTAVGLINPKLLYPIDFFDIIEDAPIKVLEKFEDGFNDGDLDKVKSCLEPGIQNKIIKNETIEDDFIGEFLGVNNNGAFKLLSNLAECDIIANKDKSDIDDDTAKIIADVEFSFFGMKESGEEIIYMKKIDGKWYITDSSSKN